MPAISIDTFFACSLMVLLVLSAMTVTAKILQPLISTSTNVEAAQRLSEVARRMLLYAGKPADWGRDELMVPEEFGLAEVGEASPYALDIDKVSRLNSKNIYGLSYAQIFTGLKTPDLSFRIEIKPVFDVRLKLTATSEGSDETTYTFEAATERDDGIQVPTVLRAYVLAESLQRAYEIQNKDGKTSFNVTIPRSLENRAILVVFAKFTYNSRIVSYTVYSFAQSSEKSAFVRLSPLNHTLTLTPTSANIVLENVYAIAHNGVWRLTQNGNVFSIPALVDPCPTVLVVFGLNATQPFVEWAAYPQVPLQVGVDFANLLSLSDVYAYTQLVSIGFGIYKCTILLGGPKT
ncbi:MAG: hypothetical protein QXQ08_01935 [Candidatus Bathyarchaeia archaeon]|nr:hypothetical protein [Candidatus Bathyarchaeota archaeon]